ncbi:MAG: YicC family protein [Acidobacteria bacterium]|nr:YicC family protein [Acidobacteriota bacterium]
MTRSMTGYARLKRPTGLGDVTFSLKSVNHRTLDLHIGLPNALEPYEAALRAVLKKRLHRGHVELRASVERPRTTATAAVNRELLDTYIASYRALAAEYQLAGEPDLNAALRLPGILADSSGAIGEPDAATEAQLVEALHAAIDLFDQFRQREGAELAADMQARQAAIASLVDQIEPHREAIVTALRTRVNQKLADMELKLDPQRLAQEAALLADRSDIAEELARLRIHTAELKKLLEAGGEMGKKLDFLLQELNREANTTLAKSANAGEAGMALTHLGLALKAEIEKIREQSLNVE